MLRVHTTILAAATIKAVGEVVISASWKQTKNQQRMERAVLIPMECVKAPEVPEQFRPLVESALVESAEQVLKKFVGENEGCFEVSPELFARPALVESFMVRADTWLTKEQLEQAFMSSATWKKFSTRPDFSTNPAVFKAATVFKDNILKLTGKATHLQASLRDQILARLSPEDLETEFGSFVVKRFEQMAKKDSVEEIDLSAL